MSEQLSEYAYKWWVVTTGRSATVGPFASKAEAEHFRETGLASWAARGAVVEQSVDRPE